MDCEESDESLGGIGQMNAQAYFARKLRRPGYSTFNDQHLVRRAGNEQSRDGCAPRDLRRRHELGASRPTRLRAEPFESERRRQPRMNANQHGWGEFIARCEEAQEAKVRQPTIVDARDYTEASTVAALFPFSASVDSTSAPNWSYLFQWVLTLVEVPVQPATSFACLVPVLHASGRFHKPVV